MSVSILDALALLPSGARTDRLQSQDLRAYLQAYCDTPADRQREQRHVLRDELYRDGGCAHMCTVIDQVFIDDEVAKRRKKWVEHARFNNPLKRIVNELSTVYQREARRYVDGGDANLATYRELMSDVGFDESMLEASRMLTLHRAILVGFRVAVRADGTREPILDVLTPSVFRPVLDPVDNKHVVGWLIKAGCRLAGGGLSLPSDQIPAWVLWTPHEVMQLTADFTPIVDSYKEHGIVDPVTGNGVAPYVAVTVGPPRAGFWCGDEGEDLVAARIAVWVANVFMLKETKSATKMPVVAGDLTRAARDQAADTDTFIEVPEGASFSTVDNSMDLTMYHEVANHVTDTTGNNYGLSPTLMNNQGVQSADARDLMRIPLNELRNQQKIAWRKAEKKIAVVASAVTTKELPERAFSAVGFRVDYAEDATPLGQAEELTLFEKKLTLGLDSRSDYLMRQNPDLTKKGALDTVESNLEEQATVQELMRPINAISGADLGGDPALVAQRQAEEAAASDRAVSEDLIA